MGYERDDALYALRVTANNLEHACTYLISNPNPSANQGLGHFLLGGPPSNQSSNNSGMNSLLQQRDELINQRNSIEQALNRLMAATQSLNSLQN